MKYIVLILKGIIIGIGKIIPGVSGGMIAISLGIYENIISSLNSILKNIKNNLLFLTPLGFGIIISISSMSNIILKFLEKYYFLTIMLFLGLIVGGTIDFRKQITKKNNKIVFLSILFISLFSLIINCINLNSINSFPYYILVGILEAFSMIIPGISGTALLIMLGCYEKIIRILGDFTKLYISTSNLSIIIPFFVGITIGIVLSIKLVNYLFEYYKNSTYNFIYGISLTTIVFMMINCFNSNYDLKQLIIGIIIFFIGVFSIKKINSLC